MTDFHTAIVERDKIIDQLTDSLKQSLQIRDQLHEQSERLSSEVNDVRKQFSDTVDNISQATRKRSWLGVENAADTSGQRLSEITLDLVSGSEYEDDEFNAKIRGNSRGVSQEKVLRDASKIAPSLEQFKSDLSVDELKIYEALYEKFSEHISRELQTQNKNYERELLLERNEKDLEINRLKQMIANVKSGTAEVKELRQELDAIHKKEMEDLRMYFERKCSDLEKQYVLLTIPLHSIFFYIYITG